ncbi:extensin family protein [Erythrobacter sp. WH131]|uniref:Extensin family protein n=2 Tax=Erythrobacter ani TaxID=2827235 RepID=A0ABS6SNE0_9SPHN|nr:extensin family protein [Erythrobacter ani]MBV7266536.1 extensin family protein [Erythrobacter ani]
MTFAIRWTRHCRNAALLSGALLLGACGGAVPHGSASRTSSDTSSPGRLASTPPQIAPRAGDARCMAGLRDAGARFSALPDSYAGPGCNKIGTVQLSALAGDGSQFGITNIGPVQCQTASAFSAWARYGVDRAARQILGSPLARIETMGSYACRNIAGSGRRSAHATAGAIDVSGFVLEDGRRITVSRDWNGGSAAEREFLRVIHESACKRFGTVLGPDYNRAHEDHFHLEGTGAEFCR